MSQNILSGTAAVLLFATTAVPLVGAAESTEEGPQIRSASSMARTLGSQSESPRLADPSHSSPSDPSPLSSSALLRSPEPANPSPANPGPSSPGPSNPSLPSTVAQGDVVKIGEQSPASGAAVSSSQSSSFSRQALVIAKVHAHEVNGRKAATLYVRNIPVLTFLGAPIQEASGPSLEIVKLGEQSEPLPVKNDASSPKSLSSIGSPGVPFFSEVKFSHHPNSLGKAASSADGQLGPVPAAAGATASLGLAADPALAASDPVGRASEIAAHLNHLNREGVDATQITVSLDEAKAGLAGDRFVIKMGETTLVTLDATTQLPDATQDRQQDALQATNRLRRLLGNAEPLSQVAYSGQSLFSPDYGAIKASLQGWASWYGPGFNGNMSASGEIFNQNDLTAAHRTLPFGTRVRVTNMDNGTSVLVRINDRGPYAGDRILDLSMGAARVLGLIQSGVAPVRLDIMDTAAIVGSR